MRKYLVGIIQLDSKNDKVKNLEQICAYIDEAAGRGAKLVALPEMMNLIGDNIGLGGAAESIPGYSTDILAQKAR
jgi:predicted amidohydrolase